jgi:RimJ/RimL family protein N-acetyltransferase
MPATSRRRSSRDGDVEPAAAELETSRLVLRRWGAEDAEALVRWHGDPVLMANMGFVSTREQSEAVAERFLAHWDEHGFGWMTVWEKETDTLVGRSGLAFHRAWPRDPEVGWLIDTPWQGRGYATEAGAACLAHGFSLGFDRIVSICMPENAPSRRVMEKLGFRVWHELHDTKLDLTLLVHLRERGLGSDPSVDKR